MIHQYNFFDTREIYIIWPCTSYVYADTPLPFKKSCRHFLVRFIPTYGHADRPPPPKRIASKKWLWMVRSVLNRTGKIIKKFSDFYFSSYHRKLGWFFHKNDIRMTIIQKIKIGKKYHPQFFHNQGLIFFFNCPDRNFFSYFILTIYLSP